MAGNNAALASGLRRRLLTTALLLAIPLALSGCTGKTVAGRDAFIGKWKSSRILTPIVLNDNGTWEILESDGRVLEYGVWQYDNNAILWTYKIDLQIRHERNPVISANRREFILREIDGRLTTFNKLD